MDWTNLCRSVYCLDSTCKLWKISAYHSPWCWLQALEQKIFSLGVGNNRLHVSVSGSMVLHIGSSQEKNVPLASSQFPPLLDDLISTGIVNKWLLMDWWSETRVENCLVSFAIWTKSPRFQITIDYSQYGVKGKKSTMLFLNPDESHSDI